MRYVTDWAVTCEGESHTLFIDESGLALGDRRWIAWHQVASLTFPTSFNVVVTLEDGSSLAVGFKSNAHQRGFRTAAEPLLKDTSVEFERRSHVLAGPQVVLTTLDQIMGLTIRRHLGLVSANVVISRNMFSDAGSDLVSLVGGNVGGIEKAISRATEEATSRIRRRAAQLEANHVLGMRMQLETVADKAQAILVYGTAVDGQMEQLAAGTQHADAAAAGS
jgi:uncharacterized protein YbjQ (UPF0145 family)